MTETAFIGLSPFQWVALVVAVLTPVLLLDALAGHYRRSFAVRAQYAPFVSGGLLVLAALAALVLPRLVAARTVLADAGWLAVLTGIVGFGFHQYHGTYRKPGGYHLWLHYTMYGAPPLAPLALTALGLLAVIAARGLGGASTVAGVGLRSALFALIALSLLGAVLQAAILHYRGAFNNPVMYVPVTIPVITIVLLIWVLVAAGHAALAGLAFWLWLTFIVGFAGLGMHLRGFDREMGGLYIPWFNVLQGPPMWAPAAFTGFAAVGLVAVYLLG